MGSGVKHQAFANVGTGQGAYNQLAGNAANVYAGLEPQLAAQAAHPAGMTPEQKAAATTAASQSAGGGTAGAIGAGRLYTARTGNVGGAKEAIGQGVRGAGQNLSDAALQTELANTALQEKQRQAALEGQQGLYGTTLRGAEEGLGLSNQALNIANQARPSFWQQMATTAGKNLVNAGLDAGEAAAGF